LTTFPVWRTAPLWVTEIAGKLPPTAASTPLWVNDLPIAGWYPDPLHGERLRYWSGLEWTELTSPASSLHSKEVPNDCGLFGSLKGDASLSGQLADKRQPVRAALFSAFGRTGGN